MQRRHIDRKLYFEEQAQTTSKYVIPFIESCANVSADARILEVGCGEGGNLLPFIQRGCEVVGVDLNEEQVARAKEYLADACSTGKFDLRAQDIFNVEMAEIGTFDFIILRDVIEHIHRQDIFLHDVKKFLRPGGLIFFGFPPWHMPFGGHQQVCVSRLLSKLPYFHLLPVSIYRKVLELFGEEASKVDELLEIKETGITIERFEGILLKEAYLTEKRELYLINPNYETKFGLKARIQFSVLSGIPWFRNFYTTCGYYLVRL